MRKGYPVPWQRLVLGAIVLPLLQVGCARTDGLGLEGADRRKSASVLVVEEASHVRPGQGVPGHFAQHVRRLAPNELIDFHFRGVDPARPDQMNAVLTELKPKVVVFLNENLLDALGDYSGDASFLIPSEFPPEQILRQFGGFRTRFSMAFLSWYADDHAKLLEYLLSISRGKARRIVAFFHDSLVIGGMDQAFLATAKQQGFGAEAVIYVDFEDFKRRLRMAVRDLSPDGLFIPISNGLVLHQKEVADLVSATGLPAIYSRSDQVEAGGLISMDAPPLEIQEHLAIYTALILHGVSATTLEIARPSRFETTVNIAAARAIGVTIPYELLVDANQIVDQ